MPGNFIEPRMRRDFSAILSVFFSFLRDNIKSLISVFLGYNLILLTVVILVGYQFISTYIDTVVYSLRKAGVDGFETLGLSMFALYSVFLIQLFYNYGLASAYMAEYHDSRGGRVLLSSVHRRVLRALPRILLMVLVYFFVYLLSTVLSVFLLIIPFFGIFAAPFIFIVLNSVLAISFMGLLADSQGGFSSAFSHGWSLVFSRFWTAVGVNLVLFLLLIFTCLALNMIPNLLIALYSYHSDAGGGTQPSDWYRYFLIATFIIFCVFVSFGLMLMQCGNGYLYYSLHERRYNIYLRNRIEKLGSS